MQVIYWEKCLWHISDKGDIYIYISYKSIRIPKNPIKMDRSLEQTFTKEDKQMVSEHMKTWEVSWQYSPGECKLKP